MLLYSACERKPFRIKIHAFFFIFFFLGGVLFMTIIESDQVLL